MQTCDGLKARLVWWLGEGVHVPRRMLDAFLAPAGKLQLQELTLPFVVSGEMLIVHHRWRKPRGH